MIMYGIPLVKSSSLDHAPIVLKPYSRSLVTVALAQVSESPYSLNKTLL